MQKKHTVTAFYFILFFILNVCIHSHFNQLFFKINLQSPADNASKAI